MNEAIQKVLKHTTFQMAIVIGGVAVTLVNLYIAVKLTPLVQDIDTLTRRADAQEARDAEARPLIERFYVVEEKTKNLEIGIEEIKEAQIRMENKIDVILTRTND